MAGRRSALIVASDEYRDRGLCRLRAAAHDAQALADVLGNADIGGFDVRTLRNEPAHVINEALEEFFADRRHDDLLLLHFSCHGVKDGSGELYLAATNTKLHRLAATAVAAEFVNRQMSRSRSRRIVLLLDCCYAGAFARGLTPRASASLDIEQRLGGRGRAVITASSALEYAFEDGMLADANSVNDSAARPSVFTGALVEGLATGAADLDQDGLIELHELYAYVYDRVREITPNQTPGKWTFDMRGSLYIARRVGFVPATGQPETTASAPVPAPVRPAAISAPAERSPLRWLPRRPSRGSFIATAIAGALAATVLAVAMMTNGASSESGRPTPSGSAAPPAEGLVIFQDNFADHTGGWPDGDGNKRHGGYYVSGGYRYWSQAAGETWWATPQGAAAVYPAAPSNIRIKAQARWSVPAWYGVSCRTVKDVDAYLFTIGEGAAHIVKMRGGAYEALVGDATHKIDLNSVNELQAECTTSDADHAVHLVLRVNGRQVSSYTDRIDPLPPGTVGTVVEIAPSGTNAEVEFHGFTVERL